VLISVILCTYNPNEKYLARALDSILYQDMKKEDWEFVVIDNNSSTPVREMDAVRQRGVRVEFEGKQGLSAAREYGIRHTRGDILVFIDDDNILAPEYLSKVKTVFDTPNIGIVSGSIAPEYEREPDGWFKDFECMLAIRTHLGERAYLSNIPSYNEYFPVGAGMACRRTLVEAYYNAIANGSAYISGRAGAQLSSAEDLDLDFFAISQGYLVGSVGYLKMKHIIPVGRTTIDYLTRLAIAMEQSTAEVNQKWKNTFGSDVFMFFSIPRRRTGLKLIVCAFLCWLPKFRVRYHVLKTRLSSQ
jgi:glycosyltransferase involved in cell wall biosynthesis